MPPLSDIQWESLEKHFQDGESLHSLAKMYDISRPAARAHLRRLGYDTSKGNIKHIGEMSDVTADALYRQLLDQYMWSVKICRLD